MRESPVDLSSEALADAVDRERLHLDPRIVELTRALIETRQSLKAIRETVARVKQTHRPYSALDDIDDIARKGLA